MRGTIGLMIWEGFGAGNAALWLRDSPEFASYLGNYHFNAVGNGKYDLISAEYYFEKELELNPNSPSAWFQLARISFVKGERTEALERINFHIERFGDSSPPSYYVRGLILGFSGRYAEAEADFRKYLELNPQSPWGWNDLGWVMLMQKEYAEVSSELTLAMDNMPAADKNAWFWNTLGVAELNLKHYENAANAFRRAAFLAESLTPADWRRANPGNNPSLAEESLNKFREVIRINLDRADALNRAES